MPQTAPAVRPDPTAILQDRFGLPLFRPGQREVIDAVLERGAVLAVFPTGGGKSLCYQLPALLLDGVAVVVSPLIALMKDQIDYLQQRGIRAARMDSSLSAEEALAVDRDLRSGELKLLYVAPERFNNERFLEQLRRARIALFAVDEAHCISEWGHNFRPDYLKLAGVARELGAERVLALTATATPAVARDVCAGFGIPEECAIVTGFQRPNLFLRTTPVAASDRDALLVERLRERAPGPGIVYVTLQRTAEQVATLLAEAGLPARAYHAGMDTDERTAVQEWWKASDRATVVATIAFGMGIDKADVRYVYHYNLPKSFESYSQEIGRAGRDGAPSTVEMLASLDDVATLENFAFGDTPTETALRGLFTEVLAGPAEFDVNPVTLGNRHDVRALVVRTTLTYLELLGVLRQGTPFYATYRVRPIAPLDEVFARFDAARARFLRGVFERAKPGREWYTVEAAAVAEALGEERERIVRALDYLGEHGWVEIQVTDARQRFTRLVPDPDADRLARELADRFARREAADVARVRQVLDLVTHPGCQTNLVLAHFGEQHTEPCDHCGFCASGVAASFPPAAPQPPIGSVVDVPAFRQLCAAHPDALGEARQRARFLCGLSSPALTRAKLSRHAWYGSLEGRRFAEVLAWCGSLGA